MGTAGPSPEGLRGTCFGFEIVSPLEFGYLRSGGADDHLRVTVSEDEEPALPGELLYAWAPPQQLEARLYAAGSGYRLWTGDTGWFRIDPAARAITVPPADDLLRREQRLLSIPAVLCAIARGDTSLHAAAAEVEGGAVLLVGSRRFGKTTLAAALSAAGHRLLSEDLSCVRPGPEPSVLPGPALLRLRHDVAERLRLGEGHHEVGRDAERVHFALDRCRRGAGCPVPLRALMFLQEWDGAPAVDRVPPLQALGRLWPSSFNLPNDADRIRCFDGVSRLVQAVPVWTLRRRLRIEDLAPTVRLLVETCLTGAG